MSIMSLFKKEGPTDHERWFRSDEKFNTLYPAGVRMLSVRHWTPVKMARGAASLLAPAAGSRVLDVGSGAGKFCMVAAHYFPAVKWYGIEQRKHLILSAEAAMRKLQLTNVFFTQGNFTQIDLKNFDHFYFFNSFYENLDHTDKIDETIEYSEELYNYYNYYLSRQLEMKPPGTKIVTMQSMGQEIPGCYSEVASDFDGELKLWIKSE